MALAFTGAVIRGVGDTAGAAVMVGMAGAVDTEEVTIAASEAAANAGTLPVEAVVANDVA
jgi:hypothetical protein